MGTRRYARALRSARHQPANLVRPAHRGHQHEPAVKRTLETVADHGRASCSVQRRSVPRSACSSSRSRRGCSSDNELHSSCLN